MLRESRLQQDRQSVLLWRGCLTGYSNIERVKTQDNALDGSNDQLDAARNQPTLYRCVWCKRVLHS